MHYSHKILQTLRHQRGTRLLQQMIPLLLQQQWVSGVHIRALMQWAKSHPSLVVFSGLEAWMAHWHSTRDAAAVPYVLQEVVLLWCMHEEVQVPLRTPLQGRFSWLLNTELPEQITHIAHEKEGSVRINTTEVYSVAETILPGVRLLRDNANPFNSTNAHPDVPFTAYSLGGKEWEHWKLQFQEAWEIIHHVVPEMAARMALFVDSIGPMGYEPHKQLSSSYLETPGVLYLSYTDTTLKQAEALVHEVHHTIYNAIDAQEPLLHNDLQCRYVSGYRPDPRHLRGCFLGVHAFAAVQEMYIAHYLQLAEGKEKSALEATIATIYNQNKVTLETLARHGQWSTTGTKVWEDTCAQWQQGTEIYESFAPAVRSTAEQEMAEHVAAVERAIASQ